MGDLIRFPGAEVDHEFLDAFAWTPELLDDYAARARAHAHRYGSNAPTAKLGRWPRGCCQDCGREAPRRYRVGRLLLCEPCAEPRLGVRREATEPPLPLPPGSISEGWEAYTGLWRIAWTAEELDRRQAQAKQRTR